MAATTSTRRNILRLVPAAVAAAAIPLCVPALAKEAGPLERLCAERRAVDDWYVANCRFRGLPFAEVFKREQALGAEYSEKFARVEDAMLATEATTAREATALLEWARHDYIETNAIDPDDEDTDRQHRIMIAAFDQALKFLRAA